MAIGHGVQHADRQFSDGSGSLHVRALWRKIRARTACFLKQHGLPGPPIQICVRRRGHFRLAGETWLCPLRDQAARPRSSRRGVFAGLRDEQSVGMPIERRKVIWRILVEKSQRWRDYRLQVAHGSNRQDHAQNPAESLATAGQMLWSRCQGASPSELHQRICEGLARATRTRSRSSHAFLPTKG